MRRTNQKEAILSAVLSMKTHPGADQIYSELRKVNKRISLGTVYRNLNQFATDGKISKVPIPGGSDKFDYRIDKHEHLLCKKCNGVYDADVDVQIGFREAGCKVDSYSLLLYGICPHCTAKEAAKRAKAGIRADE